MERQSKGWGTLWKLRLPDRLKIFAWRLHYDALPVFSNLLRRGCELEPKCHQCGFSVESTNHILFECWWSKCLWKSLNVCWPKHTESNPADWLWHFMLDRKPDELTMIIIGAWMIWKNRNALIHDKEGWTTKQCELKATSLVEQFRTRSLLNNDKEGWTTKQCELKATSLVEQFRTRSLLDNSCFFRHTLHAQLGVIIRCDGSWCHKTFVGGFAAVAFQNGTVESCFAKPLLRCTSSMESEVKGILAGLHMAASLALPAATIVSDSSQAIWAIYSGHSSSAELAPTLSECLQLLLANPRWSLCHVLREDNVWADFLANFARSRNWSWEIKDAIPRIFPYDHVL